jgi:hypothetical protein
MLFTAEDRHADSAFIHQIWRTQSERAGCFMSPAAIHWELVVMHYRGRTRIVVHGPETKATPANVPADACWTGITFTTGTFMPALLPGSVLDRNDAYLPDASAHAFWLDGAAWEYPTYDNAEIFVRRLVRAGALVHDPLVADVMHDYPLDLSPRARQYRFQRATGLTHRAVQQIQRAREAAVYLAQGCSILDTVIRLGYFDQSHLTNALRRYMGQTPAQISSLPQYSELR